MQRLFIFCGYPFSGKSTTAALLKKKFGYTIVSWDEINQFHKLGKIGYDIPPKQLEQTYQLFYQQIGQALQLGKTVIADGIAHKRGRREQLRVLAKQCKVHSLLVHFTAPVSLVQKRLIANRKNPQRFNVSDKTFQRIVKEFQLPMSDESRIEISHSLLTEELFAKFS